MTREAPEEPSVGATLAALEDAVVSGDVEAVLPLAWQVHGPRLLRRFRGEGFSLEESDELLQQVFSMMIEQWDGFDGRSLSGWLSTLARYEVLRARKSTQRHRARHQTLTIRAVPSYEMPDPVGLDETLRTIAAVVESLGDPDHTIFYLSVRQGLSPAQIAALIRPPMTAKAVRDRLLRIRKQLRAALEDHRDD